MNVNSPKSEPEKSYEKTNTKAETKKEITSKPDQKPNNKSKNKIEPRLKEIKKEPKNKIQHPKFDPKKPPRNKIEYPKFDIRREPKNKIEHPKFDPKIPPRNKIEFPEIDISRKPKNRIQLPNFDPKIPPRNKIEYPNFDINKKTHNKIQHTQAKSGKPHNKIERNPTCEPKNSTKPEVNRLSLEQIKKEISKIDWKSMSENWNVTISPNRYIKSGKITLDPTIDPSKENPLYRHKLWLKTVYNTHSWNLNDKMLEKICGVGQRTIWYWRNKFQIPTKTAFAKKKLFFNGKSKECGRCHEIKPHASFTFRRKNEILYPKSTCKKCDDEQKQIFALKNKIKVVENLYNGKLGSKCPECNTGTEKLPALEFHHINPALKKISWHSRMYKNWEQTKEILEKEQVKILCRNCHTKERTKTYNNHENLIKRTNFNLNASNKEIKEYIRKNSSKPIKGNEIYNVEHQIKKHTIVNKLYKGKCVGCEEITTQNNLPALQFHHRDINDDKSKLWLKIKFYELDKIRNELIKKNCVSLCSNCHQMIHSTNFKTQHEEIIGSEHWGQVKSFFNVLEKNVNNFKFQKELLEEPKNKPKIKKNNTKSLSVERKISQKAYQQKDKGKYIEFKKDPINQNIGVNGELIIKTKSIKKKIIISNSFPNQPEPSQKSVKKQEITKKQEKMFKQIINSSANLQLEDKIEIQARIETIEKRVNSNLNYQYGYGEAWKKYLTHITKLLNEGKRVQTKTLAESVGVNTRNTRKNIQKLIAKGMISINGEHNNRAIILTEKGRTESKIN